MTDFAAEDVSGSTGTAVTARTGTSSSDTVPAGSVVLWRNTGAGTHVVTLTTNQTDGDLAVADRTISIPAGTAKSGRVPKKWGNVNGRVQVAIDGTANEVSYYVLGGI